MFHRYQMAQALVLWAHKRFAEQTLYHRQAMQIPAITPEFRIAIKEILDHLRSALDFSARDIHFRFVGGAIPPKIYFPHSQTRCESGGLSFSGGEEHSRTVEGQASSSEGFGGLPGVRLSAGIAGSLISHHSVIRTNTTN